MTQSEPTMALNLVATLARMMPETGLLDRLAASLTSPPATRCATWALVRPLAWVWLRTWHQVRRRK